MATVLWGPQIASVYDTTSADMFAAAVVGPAVDVLASLAGTGAALEFAVGTGRVALPLSERGVRVGGSSCPRTWRPCCTASPALRACP
jgi:hypothetical protein